MYNLSHVDCSHVGLPHSVSIQSCDGAEKVNLQLAHKYVAVTAYHHHMTTICDLHSQLLASKVNRKASSKLQVTITLSDVALNNLQ